MHFRALTVTDAEAFRRLRLEALAESPLSFGASQEEEAQFPAEEWARRLGADRGVVYGAFDEQDRLAGTLGVYVLEEQGDDSGPWLWAMYVCSPARGQGVARALLRSTIAFLRNRGEARALRLQVTDASPWARALYKSAGFVVAKREDNKAWHSGHTVRCEVMFLSLSLPESPSDAAT